MSFSWFAENKLKDVKAAEMALRVATHFYPEDEDLVEKLFKLKK